MQGHCRYLNDIIVWNSTDFIILCPWEYYGTFDAQIQDRYILIKSLEAALNILGHLDKVPGCVNLTNVSIISQKLILKGFRSGLT